MITQRDLVQQGKIGFRMSWEKQGEFHREYPWLKDRAKYPNQIYISGFGQELLEYNLADEHDFHSGVFVWDFSSDTKEYMWFLDKDGKVVIHEVNFPLNFSVRKFLFFGPKRIIKKDWIIKSEGDVSARGSGIEQVLNSLEEKTADIRYILSYFEYTSAAIIYRVPNDKNFQDIIPYIDSDTRSIRRAVARMEAAKVS